MIRIVILCLAVGLAWLCAGRRITLLLDRIVTIRAASLPASPVSYTGGGLLIGGRGMTFGATNNLRADVDVTSDRSGRTHLIAGRDSFPFGPRTNPVDPRGRVEIEFVPDPGDDVRFTTRGSLLSWPTPFEMSILGGRSPWWKRYVYYRLVWKKRSGAWLEMFWRYEQQYYSKSRHYPTSGWSNPTMMWNGQTGLLTVKITRNPSP